MTKFNFIATRANGQKVEGSVEANTEQEASIKLRSQGLEPKEILLPKKGFEVSSLFAAGVKSKDLQVFTRQLATMISSGVHLVQGLEMLAKGTKSPALKKAAGEIVLNVGKGASLSSSMEQFPKIFDDMYCNMVRVGEESGMLDVVFDRLSVYIEKSVALKRKIKGAMFYPGAIVLVSSVVIAGIMIFVIPKFQELFANSGQELPMLTQIVVNMSNNFLEYGSYALVLVLILGFIFSQWKKSLAGSAAFDKALLKIPIFGKLAQMESIARFSRTFGVLMGAGVGIIEALDICISIAGNDVVAGVLTKCKESIRHGGSLTEPMRSADIIPDMVTQMVGVGEETGTMEEMLGKVADFYEAEVDVLVDSLTSVMEPLIMVVLGGIIAVLVVAMYLPVFNLAGTVG